MNINKPALLYVSENDTEGDNVYALFEGAFLELAAVSSADYLVTCNTLDFTITEFEYTRVVTPREYWDDFAK